MLPSSVTSKILNLDSLNRDVVISDVFAPFNLTLDPKNVEFYEKVRKIEYIWGDGTTDIVNFQPNISRDSKLPYPDEVGSPLNYPKTKQFYSKDLTLSVYNIIINFYCFSSAEPYVFTVTLNLKNPDLDYGDNKFFDEIHLVKTRMYGADDKILYVFQSQNSDYFLMSNVDWNLKPIDPVTIESLSRPYKIFKPFEAKFIGNDDIKLIPYVKTLSVNPDNDILPIENITIPTPTPTPTITETSANTPTPTPTPTVTQTPLAILNTSIVQTTYTSFQHKTQDMTAYVGQNIALQIYRYLNVDKSVMDYIVTKLDKAYEFYYNVIQEYPISLGATTLLGRDTVSVVDATCGSGCGFLGFTGVELLSSSWYTLYDSVTSNNQFDQPTFYEFGRNFWVDSINKIECTPGGTVTTGFAVFMRFLSMDYANVMGAPFKGNSFTSFKNEVKGLLTTYINNPSYNWTNTVYAGVAPTNTMGLGGTDMWASFMFDLYSRFGNNFLYNIWSNIKNSTYTEGNNIEKSNGIFVLALSQAVNKDLYTLFNTYYRWPLLSTLADITSRYPSYTI